MAKRKGKWRVVLSDGYVHYLEMPTGERCFPSMIGEGPHLLKRIARLLNADDAAKAKPARKGRKGKKR